MACSLSTIANIDGLARIRAALLPHLLNTISDAEGATTESDDNNETEALSKIKSISIDREALFHDNLDSENVARSAALLPINSRTKHKKPSKPVHEWMSDCHFSFSPTLNLFVIGYDQQIFVLTGRIDSSEFHKSIHFRILFLSSINFKLNLELTIMNNIVSA